MEEHITSRNNPKIKQARSLQSRKGRDNSGLFLIEGIRHIGEAIQADYPLEAIFYTPEMLRSEFAYNMMAKAKEQGTSIFEVSSDILINMAEKNAPQGVIAVAHQRTFPLNALTIDNQPWLVAVITPQDPGNVGTILRTIDAVGANGLILIDGGVDPWHPTAIRASLGACFWIPIVQAIWEDFIHWTHGYHLYGTSARGKKDYQTVDYTQPCILLLGSEREGLNELQTNACETLLRVPMGGHVSSLNLAVAAGVVMYAMYANFESKNNQI